MMLLKKKEKRKYPFKKNQRKCGHNFKLLIRHIMKGRMIQAEIQIVIRNKINKKMKKRNKLKNRSQMN